MFIKSLSNKENEALKKSMHKFDRLILLLFVVIFFSAIWASTGKFILEKNSYHGFAYWFLLLLSYPILGIYTCINLIFNYSNHFFNGHEAFYLGLAATLSLFTFYVIFKIIMMHKKNIKILQITTNILQLLIIWGIFQLFCGLSLMIWHKSGPTKELHRHLYQPEEPEPVKIVTYKNHL